VVKGKRRRPRGRQARGELRESGLARTSLFLLLLNGFVWAGLRNFDLLLVSLLSTLVALIGLLAGRKARFVLERQRGRMEGESLALIGYWGNAIVHVPISLTVWEKKQMSLESDLWNAVLATTGQPEWR